MQDPAGHLPQEPPAATPAPRAGHIASIRSWLAHAEVDRSVVFAAGWRILQAFVGVGSLLIIPRFISEELQGYYYTFYSVAAITSLMELGLHSVIVNLASHEWAHLRLNARGEPEGVAGDDAAALSRLVSLGRQVFRWYAIAAALAWVVITIVGWIVFSGTKGSEHVPWQGPWLVIAFITAAATLALPFVSLLEGCNQVAAVFKVRMTQAPLVAVVIWSGILAGLGLWAVPMGAAMALACDLWILLVRYRRFWRPFLNPPAGATMDWMREVWPMQWRLAVSALGGYFMFQLSNPVILRTQGPVEAGRMGLTLQIIAAIQNLGQAWTQTRVPQFGELIAKRQYKELDVRFYRTTIVSTSVVLAGGLAVLLGVWVMHRADFYLADRMLGLFSTAVLVLNGVLTQMSMCQSFYLRAHKREPLMVMSLVVGLLQGLLVWWWGSQYGAMGAAVAALVSMGLVGLPWETAIWFAARKRWHV
ncbi:MAG: hypothetical protein NTW19_23225 [Planctomycetota bacterium]|nr:hypothetical protein [Planctomycetota bacterium]